MKEKSTTRSVIRLSLRRGCIRILQHWVILVNFTRRNFLMGHSQTPQIKVLSVFIVICIYPKIFSKRIQEAYYCLQAEIYKLSHHRNDCRLQRASTGPKRGPKLLRYSPVTQIIWSHLLSTSQSLHEKESNRKKLLFFLPRIYWFSNKNVTPLQQLKNN